MVQVINMNQFMCLKRRNKMILKWFAILSCVFVIFITGLIVGIFISGLQYIILSMFSLIVLILLIMFIRDVYIKISYWWNNMFKSYGFC